MTSHLRPATLRRFLTPVLAGLALLAGSFAPAAAQASSSDLVDRLLGQVGGREVWASARGFHMVEILHDVRLPLPAVRNYWVDFEQPRILETTTASGYEQAQALNVDRGWTVRDGERTDWSPETVAGWSGFWPGIPTRVFHLMASDDPSLEVREREGNRLDIYVDGAFAVWIATDDDGVPVAYGREESHVLTHFLGRPEQYGPVRLWSRAYEPGDLWEVVMVRYDLITGEMPVSYDPPGR